MQVNQYRYTVLLIGNDFAIGFEVVTFDCLVIKYPLLQQELISGLENPELTEPIENQLCDTSYPESLMFSGSVKPGSLQRAT